MHMGPEVKRKTPMWNKLCNCGSDNIMAFVCLSYIMTAHVLLDFAYLEKLSSIVRVGIDQTVNEYRHGYT
jgi:hypothetical protein